MAESYPFCFQPLAHSFPSPGGGGLPPATRLNSLRLPLYSYTPVLHCLFDHKSDELNNIESNSYIKHSGIGVNRRMSGETTLLLASDSGQSPKPASVQPHSQSHHLQPARRATTQPHATRPIPRLPRANRASTRSAFWTPVEPIRLRCRRSEFPSEQSEPRALSQWASSAQLVHYSLLPHFHAFPQI
jgi:hypothetical protein